MGAWRRASCARDRLNSVRNPVDLFGRLQGGDRQAAAEMMLRCSRTLRDQFRYRIGPELRRLMDSEDLVSSVARRLDHAVSAGRATFANEAEMWGFLRTLADRVLADRTRELARLRRAESEATRGDPPGGATPSTDRPVPGVDSENIETRAFGLLRSEAERRVLTLWLRGMSLSAIATDIGVPAPTVRQQWLRVRNRLLREFVLQS